MNLRLDLSRSNHSLRFLSRRKSSSSGARIYQERPLGRFDEYAGKFVAVQDKTVYGSSRDPEFLEKYVVEKYNLNPDRLVIFLAD